MKISKKFGLLLACLFSIFGISFSQGLRSPSTSWGQTHGNSTGIVDNTTISETGSISQGSNIFSNRLEGIIRIPQSNEYSTSLGYVIALIQIAINRLLGILAFVALVYMLYNGFLVLTSGSDSKNADKGKKGISTAAIALAGIGLSWLIVSAIIWIIGVVAAN